MEKTCPDCGDPMPDHREKCVGCAPPATIDSTPRGRGSSAEDTDPDSPTVTDLTGRRIEPEPRPDYPDPTDPPELPSEGWRYHASNILRGGAVLAALLGTALGFAYLMSEYTMAFSSALFLLVLVFFAWAFGDAMRMP